MIEAQSKGGLVIDLNRLEEVRDSVLIQWARYQQAIRRYHERHIYKSDFAIGDLVLCKIQTTKDRLKL